MQNLIMQPKVQSDDEREHSGSSSQRLFGSFPRGLWLPSDTPDALDRPGRVMRPLQQSKSCLEAHASHCARCGTPMKVRILIPGCKVDYVAYRCEKCGTDVLRSVPRAG